MNESAELETSADNDRSVLQSWHEWEVDNGEHWSFGRAIRASSPCCSKR